MNVPQRLQDIIGEYIQQLNDNVQYSISSRQKYILYKSFGASRLDKNQYEDFSVSYIDFLREEVANWTVADCALNWLSILTARYIAPFWEQEQYVFSIDIKSPYDILEVAQQVVEHKIDLAEAYSKLCNDFNVPDNPDLSLQANRAYLAAYLSLEMILSDNLKYFHTVFSQSTAEPEIQILGDFTEYALQSYAHYTREKISEMEVRVAKINPKKAKEFWLWWLEQAIPQAWQLAYQHRF